LIFDDFIIAKLVGFWYAKGRKVQND